MANVLTATAIALFSLFNMRSQADTAAGANSLLFGALCAVLQQEKGAIDDISITSDWEAAHHDILDVNMSFGSPEWVNQFTQKPGNPKTWSVTEEPGKSHKHWQVHWDDWSKSAARLTQEQSGGSVLDNVTAFKLTGNQLKIAKTKVSAALKQAATIIADIKTAETEGRKGHKEAVKKDLEDAIYGPSTDRDDFTEAGRTSTTRNTDTFCNSGAKTSTEQAIADIMICACTPNSSSGANGAQSVCVDATGANPTDKTQPLQSAGDVKDQFDKLIAHCHINTNTKTTEESLNAALNTLFQHIKIHKGSAYLGYTEPTTTCDSKNNGGVCIKLAGYTTGGAKGLAGVLCAVKIKQASMALARRRRAADIIKQLTLTMKTLAEKTKTIPQTTSLLPEQSAQASSGTAPTNTGRAKQSEQIETECNKIEEKEKCDRTPGCHYDKTKEGKRCTLTKEAKETAEKASQETEGKDGKTELKCSGKKKDDCKSPDCK
uniref:Variant surface glycoprotein 1125.1080 n=1 Tax=Trypanosoma brucei TaxID=5691 RepID=A0A1J0R690_9TRYP|nr:variant surface glycoprotein 1125.1080 [Trypanosoma brucei]